MICKPQPLENVLPLLKRQRFESSLKITQLLIFKGDLDQRSLILWRLLTQPGNKTFRLEGAGFSWRIHDGRDNGWTCAGDLLIRRSRSGTEQFVLNVPGYLQPLEKMIPLFR